MPSFSCRDVMPNCSFEVKNASSVDELMTILGAHAKHAHNIEKIPPDVVEKVKKAIKP
ncbi:MAG: DUF1059 domain-containing protein [Candidatus Caldarchaeum sp.]|nr:DUF1059 domain-containing protein [Candidatus Caldarchaeum sp.]MCX8201820.1 DUF1059 domain-containing protein [Candidatus Caldarchaeum sp.]MDW8436064.1 DUF1059 domain-containing protein [Candidatus Caldarchaeum sp.]